MQPQAAITKTAAQAKQSDGLVFLSPSEPNWDNSRHGWVFGLRFEELPDFLLDHSLLAAEMEDRIAEHWERWTQFVAGLWSEREGATAMLRYEWSPLTGTLRPSLLFRVWASLSSGTAAKPRALALCNSVRTGLAAMGLNAIQMSEDAVLAALGGAATRGSGHTYLVSQEEGLLPIRLANETPNVNVPQEFIYDTRDGYRLLYEVRPWWGPGGTFLPPFTLLSGLQDEVTITTLLCPVIASDEIRSSLAAVSREAESLSQLQGTPDIEAGVQIQAGQNRTDPQLRWAARLYAANLRRLMQPFVVMTFIQSSSYEAARQMAYAYASAIREERASRPPNGEQENLESGAQVVELTQCASHVKDWITAACANLNVAWLNNHDIPSKVPVHARHLTLLRYLMDARGAAMAFRFPVCMRAGVPGIAVRQRPPDFHPGAKILQPPPGQRVIALGDFHAGGREFIDADDLTKHALIVGFTGSGKTVTTLQLIHQLWCELDIPFLVIESAKQEYRGLTTVAAFRKKSPKLRVYTVGNDRCSPIRLNPFELLPGVRVEAHISRLQTCFEAALPPVGPSSSVISEALVRVYQDKGWEMSDLIPRSGGATSSPSFPTMTDYLRAVQTVITRRGYQGDVLANVTAAIIGRLRPLTIGGKGLMLSAPHTEPSPAHLFSIPTILELNDLNLDDKALLTMFVVTMLREHRETNPSPDGSLIHATVIEEAHNVLENVKSAGSGEGASADTRYKAVQAFCSLLTEIRAFGEGLIIADQSPEKLAPDAMRNTNLQIAHQLRDSEDREAVARAMIMDEEQRDFVGKLDVGCAALFRTGLQKATFLSVRKYYPTTQAEMQQPGFDGAGFSRFLADDELAAYMDSVDPKVSQIRRQRPYLGCDHCGVRATCPHRDAIQPLTRVLDHARAFFSGYRLSKPSVREREGKSRGDFYSSTARACRDAARIALGRDDLDAAWCFFTQSFYAEYRSEHNRDPISFPWVAARPHFEQAFAGVCQERKENP